MSKKQKTMKTKKVKSVILSIVIFFFTFNFQASYAQKSNAAKHEKSLLWKITGNELEKPSYLFGTIHIIDSSYFFMDKSVIEMFGKSDKLVTEINMNDPDFQKESILASMMQNDSLDNLLSAADYKKVDAFFTDSLGIPLKAVKKMKPFFLAEFPVLLRLPKAKSYEEEFINMAKEQNKEILGITTIGKEYEIIDGIGLDIQSRILVESVDADRINEDKNRRKKVMLMYRQQDIQEIFNTMKSAIGDYDIVYQAMFPRRHEVWLPSMIHLMKEYSCFFAVGVGHLAGETGLLELLKMDGYEIKPVVEDF